MISVAILISLILSVTCAWGDDKPIATQAPCPKTTMTQSCLDCHIKGSFKVKETAPDGHLTYPCTNMAIMGWDTGKLTGVLKIDEIDSDKVNTFFRYLQVHKIKDAVIEIYSPGGGVFAAQKILALFDEWRSKGGTIETRVYGFAASAGFVVFVAGDKGKRLVDPNAHLMWHEIRTMGGWGLSVSTTSDKEQEARIMRQFQDIINDWLATRGKVTKAELDEKIRYKDWWMSGKQAIEFGFADGYIGKP